MRIILKLMTLFCLVYFISGCAMKWQSSWQDGGENNPTEVSAQLLKDAQVLFNRARDEESLRSSIGAFEKVLEENKGDYRALKQLSTQYILLGTAFTKNRSKKSKYFLKAMSYAERAMYTNPEFRFMVDRGMKPWEAANTLSAKEVEAMFFWVTALQYEFKEGMTLPGKIVNVDWLQHALVFLNRIGEVAPDFGGGAVDFARVICYYALPGSKGGSREKGDAYMQRAVERGGTWLLPRWARGKYYYPIIGRKDMSKTELEWVASQDLNNYRDPYPWRIHFQENAKQLLR